jgi:hypothetical protein
MPRSLAPRTDDDITLILARIPGQVDAPQASLTRSDVYDDEISIDLGDVAVVGGQDGVAALGGG